MQILPRGMGTAAIVVAISPAFGPTKPRFDSLSEWRPSLIHVRLLIFRTNFLVTPRGLVGKGLETRGSKSITSLLGSMDDGRRHVVRFRPYFRLRNGNSMGNT